MKHRKSDGVKWGAGEGEECAFKLSTARPERGRNAMRKYPCCDSLGLRRNLDANGGRL